LCKNFDKFGGVYGCTDHHSGPFSPNYFTFTKVGAFICKLHYIFFRVVTDIRLFFRKRTLFNVYFLHMVYIM